METTTVYWGYEGNMDIISGYIGLLVLSLDLVSGRVVAMLKGELVGCQPQSVDLRVF